MRDYQRYRLPYLEDDPGRDPQATAFLTSILENPDDDSVRLIFADWLDEQGMADKAKFVRHEVEMSRLPRKAYGFDEIRDELDRLDVAIGGEWTDALIRPGRLLNCGKSRSSDRLVRFAFECPKRWADLKETSQPEVRYCDGCRKHVHFCSSADEAERHGIKGDCIAVSSQLALAVAEKHPVREKVHRLSTVVGEWMPDEEMADRDSPCYRWAEEFFVRRRQP